MGTPTFYIGLTMAGAISAGAYSAGAFDFLMEALDAWEAEKKRLRDANVPESQWAVPCHEVVIPVMSGASAGGITGALGLIALADTPAAEQHQYTQVGTVTTRLPRLYKAWVQMPKFVDAAGGPDLLGTGDLKGQQEVEDQDPNQEPQLLSLLDSTILWQVVKSSFANLPSNPTQRVYLADTIHLFLTHTNLRGVPFEIGFGAGNANQPGYPMLSHADRRHFTVTSIGLAQFASKWAMPDPALNIDLTIPPNVTHLSDVWKDFAFAALGTSAFPVGLRARIIRDVVIEDYSERQWTLGSLKPSVPGGTLFRLPARFPPSLPTMKGTRVDYVTTDGGVINNEPFELARWTLMDNPPDGNPRDIKDCDRAVIMIDPFPERPDFDESLSLDNGIAAVIGRLIPILKDQARFKPDDLVAALDESILSRFLIAPRRRSGPQQNAPLEPFAIACGLLGGFGGFLSEEFRAHDYQLGRLNAHFFLRNSFAAPLNNQILSQGYAAATARVSAFQAPPPEGSKVPDYQIIPLVGSAAQMPQPPMWPRVARSDVDAFVERARGRAKAVFEALLRQKIRSRTVRLLLRMGWTLWGSGAVDDAAQWSMLHGLLLRDQIDGPTAGKSSDDRMVIAALANASFDFRTTLGIARETGLSEAVVSRALKNYASIIYQGSPPKSGAGPIYTLQERRPSWYRRIPIIKDLNAWFAGDPVID